MTNAIRAEAGLPARDGTRSTVGAPTTMPIGRIEPGGHYTLILHFVDELTPTRLTMPEGVYGLLVSVVLLLICPRKLPSAIRTP